MSRTPIHPGPDPLDDPVLLASMSPSLVALARRGERRRFEKGATLIVEGDQSDTLFILLGGEAEVYSLDAESGKRFVFNTHGPGQTVGEMSLDGGPRSASVEAKKPVLCSMVTRPVLEAHLQADPRFAFELLATVIGRARVATLTARTLAFNDVYGRMKVLLETLARRQPDGRWVVSERLTHQEIADRCGCTREMITKVRRELVPNYLRELEGGGVELRVFPLPTGF